MSLFGSYGQKNGNIGGPLFSGAAKASPTAGGPLFPAASKASPPVAHTPAPSMMTKEASPISPEASMPLEGGPCQKFCLDMLATQFGMCKCGFDRNAHDARKESGIQREKRDSVTPAVEKRESATPPAVPKLVPATGPMPPTTKASSMPVVQGKGKGKGKGKAKPATGIMESNETPVEPPVETMLFQPPVETKQFQLPVESKPKPAVRQKSSDAIAQLQAVIQGAGFSPLSSDAGTEAAKNTSDLPDFLRSALLTIMNASSQNTDNEKRVSFDEASVRSFGNEPISRDDSKVLGSTSFQAPKSSIFKSAPPAMFKASVPAATEPNPQENSDEDAPAPCNNFQVDLTSSQFGMCRCGFDRPSHSKPSQSGLNQTILKSRTMENLNQSATMRGRDTEVAGAASRFSSAPPPPSNEQTSCPPCKAFGAQVGMRESRHSMPNKSEAKTVSFSKTAHQIGSTAMIRSASARFARTPSFSEPAVAQSASDEPEPCSAFQLDLSSSQFAMCKCGFDRNAHKQVRQRGDSDPTDNKAFARKYTLDELRSRKTTGNLDGLDAGKLEDFLEEREFLKGFGMFIADFYKLPSWKQKQLKQKVGIF